MIKLYNDDCLRVMKDITTAVYNDGKRGFKGWAKIDDLKLFELLDNLEKRKVR